MKERRNLGEKDIDEVFGGNGLNAEYRGKHTFIGNGLNYEQMLEATEELSKSGKLDYLKKK